MQQNLKGVPETLLIPLWARAAETKRQRPIIKDEKAVELMAQMPKPIRMRENFFQETQQYKMIGEFIPVSRG